MKTDLSKSFGYRVLQEFLAELSIEFSTDDSEPTSYCHDDVLEADILWNVPQQPFELNPEENYEKVIHVGDIHGDFKSLYTTLLVFFKESLLKESLNDKVAIVFTGDYVDRGLDSMLCILLVAKFIKAGVKNVFFLRGNHETESGYVFGFEKDGDLSEMAANDLIKRLSTVLYLRINDRKAMFIHGLPIVRGEPVSLFFRICEKEHSIESIKEQLNSNLECVIERFDEYVSESESIGDKLLDMPIEELDTIGHYEDSVKSFIEVFEKRLLEIIQNESFEDANEKCLKMIEELENMKDIHHSISDIAIGKLFWFEPISTGLRHVNYELSRMLNTIKIFRKTIYKKSRGYPKPIPKEISTRLYDSCELLWGDVSTECDMNNVVTCPTDGRQKIHPKLIDEYMLKNGLSIIFRGHQCPVNNGWDVYANQELAESLKNNLEDFKENIEDKSVNYDLSIFQEIPVIHDVRKALTINLKETDRMISTIHTTEVYDDIAPRTFLMTDGLTTEAFRIE